MHMQFYESEAYYWLAVRRMAELLALVEPDEKAAAAIDAVLDEFEIDLDLS